MHTSSQLDMHLLLRACLMHHPDKTEMIKLPNKPASVYASTKAATTANNSLSVAAAAVLTTQPLRCGRLEGARHLQPPSMLVSSFWSPSDAVSQPPVLAVSSPGHLATTTIIQLGCRMQVRRV